MEALQMGQNGLVLVDGAAGYLGQRVVKELIDAGYRVRATDLPSGNFDYVGGLGAEVCPADLLDKEALVRITDGVDYVVHCAALFSLTADIDALRKVNVTGTGNLIRACSGRGIKHFIHISSSDIYGKLEKLPGDETHPQEPINDYAVSKKEGEEVVLKSGREQGIPVTIIRPSAIYGPGSIYIAGVFFFWPIFIRFLKIPFYPYIKGGSKLTFAHIDDVAGSICFLLGRKEAFGEAFNVADQEYMYSAVFACKLCHAFNVKNMLPFSIPLPHFLVDIYGKMMLFTSGPMLRLVNRWVKKRWLSLRDKFGLYPGFTPHFERQFYNYFIGHRYFSSQKLINLGYKFRNRSFDQGFPGTVQWYLDNKWLPPIDQLGKKI